MFLEDSHQHAEFPNENGEFSLSSGSYKVCGDEEPPPSNSRPPSPPPPAWSAPLQWRQQRGRTPFLASSQGRAGPSTQYESSYFKRCIPFVSLSLNKSGKSIVIETTEENVFVKIPESTLSVDTILAELGKKVSLAPSDLVLLDSKFLSVSDDKGKFKLRIIINR